MVPAMRSGLADRPANFRWIANPAPRPVPLACCGCGSGVRSAVEATVRVRVRVRHSGERVERRPLPESVRVRRADAAEPAEPESARIQVGAVRQDAAEWDAPRVPAASKPATGEPGASRPATSTAAASTAAPNRAGAQPASGEWSVPRGSARVASPAGRSRFDATPPSRRAWHGSVRLRAVPPPGWVR